MAEDLAGRFGPRTLRNRQNAKILSLRPLQGAVPNPPNTNPGTGSLDDLEITVEFRLDVTPEDLEIEYSLNLKAEHLEVYKNFSSSGSGSVSLVRHTLTNKMMVRKVLYVEGKATMRKRIVRELQVMHDCNSPYLVLFYGAFQSHTDAVVICMEYMDVGSGPIRIDVLGKIAEAVFGGLSYLYSKHRIMHRDVRPTKILVDSRGRIKLCGFGISHQLIGSIAETFTGTSFYMSPERIRGEAYTVKSDTWSVGLTLLELAVGKFPFSHEDSDEPGSIMDVMQEICFEPSPKLPPSEVFPGILEELIDSCLLKDPKERKSPQELYANDPFVLASKRTTVDLKAWAATIQL